MSEGRKFWRTKIAAHRGGADLWPENSFAAFRGAAGLAIDYVEFDVHPTREGTLVVHHDATLDRMTNGTEPISEKTWEELSTLRIRGAGGERMPLLTEVMELFKPTSIDLRLEVKVDADRNPYPGLTEKIARVLAESGMTTRSVITSFYLGILKDFLSHAQPAGLIWLIGRVVLKQAGGILNILRLAAESGIEEIALHESMFGEDAVAAAAGAGVGLGAYAVNNEEAMRRVISREATGFTSDRPDIAVKIREEIGRYNEG